MTLYEKINKLAEPEYFDRLAVKKGELRDDQKKLMEIVEAVKGLGDPSDLLIKEYLTDWRIHFINTKYERLNEQK